MYEEAMERRRDILNLQSGRAKKEEAIQPGKLIENRIKAQQDDMLDLREDELRDFLLNRLAELKMASTYGLSNNEINKSIYKYKASTLSNILPHDEALAL